jgi:hypothetical protein
MQSKLIKKKIKFSSYIRNSEDRVQSHIRMTNDLLIYGENICAFPHILGSPSSYMTLHPIPSEYSLKYDQNFVYFFISVRRILRGSQQGEFRREVELRRNGER